MELTHTDIEQLADLVAAKVAAGLNVPVGKWLTMEEAMAYAKVKSKNTIKQWIRQGRIHGFRRSGKGNWIIDRESIDDWYNSEEME